MGTARKFFIGRVLVPALQATSLYAMMRDCPLHWGFETTALTDPSFDAMIGDELKVTPDGPVLVGSDSTVATNGITITATTPLTLQDFAKYGLIDLNQIYFWNQSGVGMAVTFHGR